MDGELLPQKINIYQESLWARDCSKHFAMLTNFTFATTL